MKVSNAQTMGAVLSGAVIAYSAALAEPVKDADLRGKKICWSSGIATYGKNGSFYVFPASGCGHATWSLSGGRVEIRSSNCADSFSITKENRTFHALGNGYEGWGKYCK
jgi:hypothetical protein